MEERPPLAILFEVVSDVLRQKNVAGVAAIHHSLRHVNASAGTFARSFTSVISLIGPE